jgi:hypothetical protein
MIRGLRPAAGALLVACGGGGERLPVRPSPAKPGPNIAGISKNGEVDPHPIVDRPSAP